MASQYLSLPLSGAGGVTSLNSQTGDVDLIAGSNVSITPGAGTLTISAVGAGFGDINDGGNTFGSDISIGSNDAFALKLRTNNTIASTADTSQQWSFGFPNNGTRIHGFYKDINSSESSTPVYLQVGNSGAAQGAGYLGFTNQLANNAPSFDFGFAPRNNADSAAITMGLIRIQKSVGNDGSNIYFSNTDTAGTLNLVLTIRPDGTIEMGPEKSLQFDDAVGGQYVAFKAPATVNASTTYVLPDQPPASDMVLQSDSSSNLSWVAQTGTPTGSFNTFTGFDGSGNIFSIPGFNISTVTGGAAVSLTETVATDNFGDSMQNYEVEVDPSIVTTNVNITGFNIGLHHDRTGSNNNYGGSVNGLSNTLSLEGDGAVNYSTLLNMNFQMGTGTNTGTLTNGTAFQVGSSVQTGYTTSSFNGIRNTLEGAGSVGNATMMTNIASVSTSGNLDLLYSSFGGGVLVGGNLRVIQCDINGDVTGDVNGLSIGFGGDTGGNMTISNLSNNGVVTGNMSMINLNNNGDVGGDFSGMNISANGTITGNAAGININLGGATTTTQKQGININGASFQGYSDYNTGIYPASPGYLGLNSLGGNFQIASGSPVTGTIIFGNNLGTTTIFEDDMGPDGLGGIIGFSMNGFASQFTVAVGKTVDVFNFMAAGASVPTGVIPTDGGTITEMSMFRSIGTLPAGGSVVIDKMYGFKGDIFLSTFATNTWGVHISDPSADNWFKKNVVIGGVTEQPTGAFALDVTGDATVSGDIAAATMTPANGATGTFTTTDLKTVTVTNGIITSIV